MWIDDVNFYTAEEYGKIVLKLIETQKELEAFAKAIKEIKKERDEYALLLFQPCGESHHDANICPYCQEYLNGKTKV